MKQNASPQLVKLTRRRGMSETAFERMMELLAGRREGIVATDELLGSYAESVEEGALASDDSNTPHCLECGACCSYFHQVPVLITDPTPRTLTWKVWEGGDRYGPALLWLRREPEAGRCVALDGRVGERALCAIYELRPRSCREFEAGSDRCHAVRRLYGLEPRLAERELTARARAYSTEDREQAELEGVTVVISDETDRLKLFEELIDFSREKLDYILAEAERLLEFFDERRLEQGAARCRQDLKAIGDEAKAVAGSRLVVPENVDTLGPREVEELAHNLLTAGVLAHEALERASRRLADLGMLAFEISGMRDRMSEAGTGRSYA